MTQVGIGAKPDILPLSIGDGVLAEYADSVVSVPEIFNYWLQAGRVDVGFLGAAQMDRYGNINTTVIGPYESPEGATPRRRRSTRDRGFGEGSGGHPQAKASRLRRGTRLRYLGRASLRWRLPQRAWLQRRGSDGGDNGPWHLEARSRDEGAHDDRPSPRHHGSKEATDWELKVAEELETTDPSTEKELGILRELKVRTEASRNQT